MIAKVLATIAVRIKKSIMSENIPKEFFFYTNNDYEYFSYLIRFGGQL